VGPGPRLKAAGAGAFFSSGGLSESVFLRVSGRSCLPKDAKSNSGAEGFTDLLRTSGLTPGLLDARGHRGGPSTQTVSPPPAAWEPGAWQRVKDRRRSGWLAAGLKAWVFPQGTGVAPTELVRAREKNSQPARAAGRHASHSPNAKGNFSLFEVDAGLPRLERGGERRGAPAGGARPGRSGLSGRLCCSFPLGFYPARGRPSRRGVLRAFLGTGGPSSVGLPWAFRIVVTLAGPVPWTPHSRLQLNESRSWIAGDPIGKRKNPAGEREYHVSSCMGAAWSLFPRPACGTLIRSIWYPN